MPGAITIRPRIRSSLSAPANLGVPDSSNVTVAVHPGVRMFDARQTIVGPSSSGSTRRSRVCLGSTADTTARAPTSSPEESTTPTARPSVDRTAVTEAFVRISAPNERAAPSSAPASAAGPPLAKAVCPAAPPSFPAESDRSTAEVPAVHGPMAVNVTARAATAPRNSSRSNASPTRSATGMGRTRRVSLLALGPRRRNARTMRRPASASPSDGLCISGGGVTSRYARKLAMARTRWSNSG